VPPVIESSRPDAPSRESDDDAIPLWGLGLGLLATLLIGGYIVAHALSAGNLNRYTDGFPMAVCPICDEGHLILEERPYNVLGIPRVRRTVRCDNCRSVLREVGNRQWRYAVDPAANPDLYERLNNEVLGEERLMDLAFEFDSEPPAYFDDDL
jgi:hypothetical protein